MPRRLATVFVAPVVTVAVLAGCGGGGDASSSTDASAAAPASEPQAAAPAVLRFTAPVVGGGELAGASLAGRPVAFWFWAPT